MKSLVLYSSLTGNTKKLAEIIYEELPNEKVIKKISDKENLQDYDLIIIGYWVDKGICDNKSKEILQGLTNKKVILFGTLGAANFGQYYSKVKSNVEKLIEDKNKILGHFLCQGSISEQVIKRLEEKVKVNPDDEHIKAQLEAYKLGLTHPDEKDLENCREFIKDTLKENNILC